MSHPSLTAADFRRALGQFSTGVTVVTVERAADLVHGMTANSFTSVSLAPPLVLICVDHKAKLLPLLQKKRRFGVSILKAEQQAISEYFATGEQTPEAETRLGIRYHWTKSGIPLLEGTLAQLACHVIASHVGGDHTIFVGEVESGEIHAGEPLLFFRGKYHHIAAHH